MSDIIQVVVTEQNSQEVLNRKQNGENICSTCIKQAFNNVLKLGFTLPVTEEEVND